MTPLAVNNVRKTYRQGDRSVVALDGVSLSVERGQFLAVMGASGSGKSTLLHLMAGLAPPDSGEILIDGQDITALSDRQLTLFRRQHIGLVFQAFNLIPTLTARENVALPLMLDGRALPEIYAKADELLEMLSLSHRREHRPDVMSGGEQQRVAIGRALASDPAILLADEPTGNLDRETAERVFALVRQLARELGIAFILVSHDLGLAKATDRVLELRDGALSEVRL